MTTVTLSRCANAQTVNKQAGHAHHPPTPQRVLYVMFGIGGRRALSATALLRVRRPMMKVTLAHDATEVTISDPNIGYSPDVLQDWTHRALETLTTFTVAITYALTQTKMPRAPDAAPVP